MSVALSLWGILPFIRQFAVFLLNKPEQKIKTTFKLFGNKEKQLLGKKGWLSSLSHPNSLTVIIPVLRQEAKNLQTASNNKETAAAPPKINNPVRHA